MEKINIPHVDAVIGLPSEKGLRRAWLDQINKELAEGGRWIKNWEISKTKRDREIIAFVQETVWNYLRYFGRTKKITMPLKNIHLLKVGGVEAISNGEIIHGMHTDLTGSITVNRFENDTLFALTLFHEFYHLGAYKVFRILPIKNGGELICWRQGMSGLEKRGNKICFKWAEEAIIEHMTHKFYKQHLQNHPDFPKLKKPLKLNREVELFDLKEFDRIARLRNKKNRWKIKNATRVIHLFCVAQSTGHWLPIARLSRQVFDNSKFFRKMANHS